MNVWKDKYYKANLPNRLEITFLARLLAGNKNDILLELNSIYQYSVNFILVIKFKGNLLFLLGYMQSLIYQNLLRGYKNFKFIKYLLFMHCRIFNFPKSCKFYFFENALFNLANNVW